MTRTRIIVCPDCSGSSLSRSDVGGIVYGGCDRCGGSGLIHR